ncbi:hypothetical protein AB4186_25100, partial [Vibrio lentus]
PLLMALGISLITTLGVDGLLLSSCRGKPPEPSQPDKKIPRMKKKFNIIDFIILIIPIRLY